MRSPKRTASSACRHLACVEVGLASASVRSSSPHPPIPRLCFPCCWFSHCTFPPQFSDVGDISMSMVLHCLLFSECLQILPPPPAPPVLCPFPHLEHKTQGSHPSTIVTCSTMFLQPMSRGTTGTCGTDIRPCGREGNPTNLNIPFLFERESPVSGRW